MNDDSAVPDGTKALIQSYDVLERLHQALDQGQAELEQAIGGPICTENCGKCCQENTPIAHITEVRYILSTILLQPGMREKLIQHSLDWLTYRHPGIASYGVIVDRPKNQQERDLLTRESKVAVSRQCPFLTAEKRCMIHQARLVVCRAYGITILADQWCPRPLHSTETDTRRMSVGADTKLGQVIKRLSSELCESHNGATANYVGILPFLLAKELAPDKLQGLIDENRIADVKRALGRPMLNLFFRTRLVTLGAMGV